MKRVGVMGFAYCISAFMDCTIAASRGLGKTVVPTVIVVLGSCVFRVIWSTPSSPTSIPSLALPALPLLLDADRHRRDRLLHPRLQGQHEDIHSAPARRSLIRHKNASPRGDGISLFRY